MISFTKVSKDVPPAMLGKPQYRMALPDLPAQPIFLETETNVDDFVTYQFTSMEKAAKYPLLTEPDLGVPIDLVSHIAKVTIFHGNDANQKDQNTLSPEDEDLLPDDDDIMAIQPAAARNRSLGHVPWMRKGLLISDEPMDGVKRHSVSLKPHQANEPPPFEEMYSSVDKTFKPLNFDTRSFRHPSKKHLRVKDCSPLLPAADQWVNLYWHVSFPNDPKLPTDVRLEQSILQKQEDTTSIYLPTPAHEIEEYNDISDPTSGEHETEKGDLSLRTELMEEDDYESASVYANDREYFREYEWKNDYSCEAETLTPSLYTMSDSFALMRDTHGRTLYVEIAGKLNVWMKDKSNEKEPDSEERESKEKKKQEMPLYVYFRLPDESEMNAHEERSNIIDDPNIVLDEIQLVEADQLLQQNRTTAWKPQSFIHRLSKFVDPSELTKEDAYEEQSDMQDINSASTKAEPY
ncbi:putative RNA polymerase II-associated factor 1 [Monocercomonoides exilis]|uniref:putative RNA polymerase II-associated factor 1 n=1 Tax=Monocercomonoides exilis TaxID=2049356 RepID=UPI00355A4F90|nr:putative RNA polymerase II-associated factor 1 [Monocercomonoides exilis]|eukprot:MONOS_5130.1-p1 / transcript=MONOS_5130.1 / gene=MONOS_5130 / organism=Monocercomonoides_exilis_PA203 / gene_product=unspecified product / transcript_product=unspecified product / location=Mono_scaffold00146:19386-21212(+) / protein_length=462 / sequence_SO=supercontig / SO=protein_coding / is_pseudo=false